MCLTSELLQIAVICSSVLNSRSDDGKSSLKQFNSCVIFRSSFRHPEYTPLATFNKKGIYVLTSELLQIAVTCQKKMQLRFEFEVR